MGPFTCTAPNKDGKQCERDGVVVYRRHTDVCIYIVCEKHDTEKRRTEAVRTHYLRFEL